MTENDQEIEKISGMKNELLYRRDQRNFYGFNPFAIIDREYLELLNLPEGKNNKSSFSGVIYIIGVTIFLLGVIESFTVVQLIGTNSFRDLQLSGIGLLTAFISSMIFVGFGKAVELIVFRGKKALRASGQAMQNDLLDIK